MPMVQSLADLKNIPEFASGFLIISRRHNLANIKSAKKRIRTSERQRVTNLAHRGRARTEVKKARAALASGDVEQAEEAVRTASSYLDRAATKGVIHRNNASRRKGRLAKHLAELKMDKS